LYESSMIFGVMRGLDPHIYDKAQCRETCASQSPLEQPHDLCLRECIEMQVEAHDRGRSVDLHVKPVGLHREDREQITVWVIALGRTWSAITGRAKIGPRLQRTCRQLAACAAGAKGKLAHVSRNVHHQPVPEAGAGWRIGVKAGDSETLCARRRA